MLLRNLWLLREDPLAFSRLLAAISLALLVAITVHEFSHALAAYRLGDATAKSQGRLSLNPLVHLDPIGTLLLFLVGFGWGKPVPVNASQLRGGARRGMAWVALAGPVAGLVTAGILSLPFRLGGLPFNQVLLLLVFYNIILSIFNLIPLPPLDGFNVARGFLPFRLAYSFSRLENYGPMLLIFIIFLDSLTGLGLLWRALGPAVNMFSLLFLGGRVL